MFTESATRRRFYPTKSGSYPHIPTLNIHLIKPNNYVPGFKFVSFLNSFKIYFVRISNLSLAYRALLISSSFM
jgi:hypothetical protein